MPAPTTTITVGDRGAARPAPDDVGGLFMIALTEMGPVGKPVDSRSYNAWQESFGSAIADSFAARTVESYFREGGTRVVTSRGVGPTPTSATLNLNDGATTPLPVLVVTAVSPGEWAHALTVTVTTEGTDRRVVLAQDGDTIADVTTSNEADVITALEATGLVTVTAGAGTWPIANLATTALAGGNSDHANITQTEWNTALNALDSDLGAGTIAAPGITTAAMHSALLAHAATRNRFALLDAIDTATVATLTAAATSLRGDVNFAYGQMLAPWERVPGPGAGTVIVPPSGPQAGRLARADIEWPEGPGQYAGADFGLSRHSVDVTQSWTGSQRDTLSDAGVVVIRLKDSVVQAYDDITLADSALWPQYVSAAGMRVLMAIRSQAKIALDSRQLQTIDGNGHLLSAVEKDLVGICQSWYRRGALFGETAGEAFAVTVTNPEPRKVAAELLLVTSDGVRAIALHIVKVASGDTI